MTAITINAKNRTIEPYSNTSSPYQASIRTSPRSPAHGTPQQTYKRLYPPTNIHIITRQRLQNIYMEEFKIIAKTFQGLEEVLAKELIDLGANNVEIGRRMVA